MANAVRQPEHQAVASSTVMGRPCSERDGSRRERPADRKAPPAAATLVLLAFSAPHDASNGAAHRAIGLMTADPLPVRRKGLVEPDEALRRARHSMK